MKVEFDMNEIDRSLRVGSPAPNPLETQLCASPRGNPDRKSRKQRKPCTGTIKDTIE